MAQPRLDDANIEFTFSPEEARAARMLNPLQIMWFQDKYAKKWKQKAGMLVPESMELDRSYIQKICEIDGQLNFIQELLDDHKQVQAELQALAKPISEGMDVKLDSSVKSIATAAGQRVHSG